MKILVAGGAGYIGSVLVPMLIDAGHQVVVLDRLFFGDRFFGKGAGYEKTINVPLLLLQKDTREVLHEDFYGVDRVIDLAGLSNDPSCDLDPEFTISVNFGGALHLARTAYEAGVREYVYASSCAVYGFHDSAERPDENAPLNPLSEYARSKAAVEAALRRIWHHNMFPTARLWLFRLSTVYGVSPRMRFDLAPNLMMLRASRGQPIELWNAPDTWRPFIHVRDVARMMGASKLPMPSTYNLGSDAGTMTISTLAKRVAAFYPDTKIEHKPSESDARSYAPKFDMLTNMADYQQRPDAHELLPQFSLEHGLGEIASALKGGLVDDELTYTVQRYRRLLEAGKLCRSVL